MTREQLRDELESVLVQLAAAEAQLQRTCDRLNADRPAWFEQTTLANLQDANGGYLWHGVVAAKAHALAALVAVSS